ncbi:MAG: cupredoxin domain-containing protein [Candidatus Doudnabacteria bacterium]|nr:cupredoxin domain-containing protein [Candidatus Doudnabacteria bacterium]
MKKLLILTLGMMLLAAACNKSNTTSGTVTTPTPTPSPEVSNPTPNPEPPVTPPVTPPASTSAMKVITYTSTGFSPATVTIKKGTTVNFVNNSSGNVWPASDPHPSHTDYPGFDPRQAIPAGQSWAFTFDKVGTWGYHNHLNPAKRGSITVTE